MKRTNHKGRELELHTWFERDRKHVELRDSKTDETLIEFWDDEVDEMIQDGFLNPSDYLGSIVRYAESVGVL